MADIFKVIRRKGLPASPNPTISTNIEQLRRDIAALRDELADTRRFFKTELKNQMFAIHDALEQHAPNPLDVPE